MRDDATLTMRCGALRCRLEGFEDPFAALAGLAPWLGALRADEDGEAAPDWASAERRDGVLVLSPAGLEDAAEAPPQDPAPRPSPFTENGAPWAREGAVDRRFLDMPARPAEDRASPGDGVDAFVFARTNRPAEHPTSALSAPGAGEAEPGLASGDRRHGAGPGTAPPNADDPEAPLPAPGAHRPAEGAECTSENEAERPAPNPARAEGAESDWSEETVVRLAEAARARLSGPEAERRRDSLSHLRHAAQARDADGPSMAQGPYRNDLRDAVRAHIAPAEGEAHDAGAMPLLLLTAERRIDALRAPTPRDPPPPVGPVQPRRVRRVSGARLEDGAHQRHG